MNDILLFTGNSGAGKSTVARHIGELFSGVHLSEREISRSLALEEGYTRSRFWVQDTGLENAAEMIRRRTVELIGDHQNRLVIVDGVYDSRLPSEIESKHIGRRVGVVALEATEITRVQRYAQRLGGIALSAAQIDISYLDNIKERVGANEVIAAANLRVVNEGAIEVAVEAVSNFYKSGMKAV